MRWLLLAVALPLMAVAAFAQKCESDELARYAEIKQSVSRLLDQGMYTGWDDKLWSRSGDLAAVAVIRSRPEDDFQSPEKIRRILLLLRIAFARPEIITPCENRKPTATLFLLHRIQNSEQAAQFGNEIPNLINQVKLGAAFEVVAQPGEILPDQEHTEWISSVLREVMDLKPGMSRKDLHRLFTTEGGLSTNEQRTYVLRACPYIKIDVHFAPAAAEHGDDKIVSISRPYLQFSIMD